MSARSEFYDEVYKLLHEEDKDFEESKELIRDKWIKEKKYNKLIAYILDDYTSRNCIEFMTPLVEQLTKEKKLKLYKRIWTPVIRYNAKNFWIYQIHNLKIDYPNITWSELEAINTSYIKPYGEWTDDEKENAAFWGKYYLNAIELCKSGLEKMGDIEEVKNFNREIQSIHNLKQEPFDEPSKKIIIDKRKIDETVFWELIDNSRKEGETKDEFFEILKEKLLRFKAPEMKRFQKLLLTYQNELNHWNVWALAYIVRRGCGDDCFDYFRLWVVSKGKEAYELIKDYNTSKFKAVFDDEDPIFEDFEYLAGEVYEENKGKAMRDPNVKMSKIKGNEWDEENIYTEFLELCNMFDFKGL
ncbi:hypothetical protein A8C32_17620 [Flavivirga aquatica]|uniref:DUF4240 domain-containing protein n=1 Tax=Flavivirga aquatica TaxID=1849968 RepID=A0A1E5T8A4_9FLAO|nr:DUF4240 domain-containing protein [Flavivirga aquatica]OEK07615.1 hypothetical protein A8C32_17620 [Flavivirga aquatica]